MITVVTTCSNQGLDQYGRQFIESFEKYWSRTVHLLVYAENWTGSNPCMELHDLLEESPWLREFCGRHKYNLEVWGQGAGRRHGYRWNCGKFAYKVAAILAADQVVRTRYMLWLDADIVTHAPVAYDDIYSWMPHPYWLSWLDRDPKVVNYPECSFLLFDRWHPRHFGAFKAMQELYVSDDVLQLDETHDSFVWQHLVKTKSLSTRSLSGEGYGKVHVFANSPLSKWMDHLKGPSRKKLGRTRPQERLLRDKVAYWD